MPRSPQAQPRWHDAASAMRALFKPRGAYASENVQWLRWAVVGAFLGALLCACGGEAAVAAKPGTEREYLMVCRVGGERDLTKGLGFAAVVTETSTGLEVALWQVSGTQRATDPENRVRRVATLPEAPFTDDGTWESSVRDVTLPPSTAVSAIQRAHGVPEGSSFDRISLRATARSLRCAELRASRGALSVVATCAFLHAGAYFELGPYSVSTHAKVDVEKHGDRVPPVIDTRRSEEFCAP